MSDTVSPANNQAEGHPQTAPQSRSKLRFLGLVFILLAVLLGWYLLVGFLGWQSGQSAMVVEREAEMKSQIERQLMLARENIDQGSYNLALRRLDYILDLEPGNSEALTLQEQTQGLLDAFNTPQPTTIATATATPSPEPSATPGLISDPETELQRIRRLVANQEWSPALAALTAFQRQFPEFERQDTDKMLYDVYVAHGLLLLEGAQVELGLFYLDQAAELGDLSQEVLDYQLWAELYLQGIAFYNVNWDVATYYFRELCLSAPFYQSACERLQESLENFADQYVVAMDYCPAQELYQEALSHGRSQPLLEKLNNAAEACLLATPTPLAPITDTLPITGTEPLIDAPFFIPATATADSDN
jgi:tetratricopeptide (TPR) repeat protein